MTTEKLLFIVCKFGKYPQIMKFAEEAGELIQAINKHEFGDAGTDGIHEEYADMMLMLDQIFVMYDLDSEKILEIYNKKLERTYNKALKH